MMIARRHCVVHLPPLTAMHNLPRRRYLAAALAAGTAPLFIRHAGAAASEQRFALGLASGCPRPDRLVLWTRLMGDDLPASVPVQWELADDEAFQRIVARGTEQALLDDAHSVHAEPQGLQADRWYWYRFQALGSRSMVGRTRTAPAPDAASKRLRFAIASCQRWDQGEYAAWRDMATQDLDLVLFLGDYIYEYATPATSSAPRRHEGGPCRSLADYRARYAQYKRDPALQAMHAMAPWILTWDDHEVENDYAANQSQTLDPAFPRRRIDATKAYWEHQPFPKALRPKGSEMRIYGQYDWGRLARLITLDDRQWRDPQVCPKPGRGGSNTLPLSDCPALLDPKRSLLGAAQEQWLAGSWDAERPWNLLAQQTLMARLNWGSAAKPRYWTDAWDGYPAARQRLLQGMLAAKARNPVVLGGDVHANYVADLKLDFDDPTSAVIASEFCGTSISSQGLLNERVERALPQNPHIHLGRSDERGYMLFQLQAERLDVELRSVLQPWEAQSGLRVQARFAVEAGRPGPQPTAA